MSTTERPLPTDGPSAGGDEFDDLFNYDVDVDDPFSENYVVPGSKEREEKEAASKEKSGDGLGLDEAVDITRKPRAPRVKLDENRLLSANGIPKLRAKARHHLKFKGKGHEYSDASRLLSFYQLWLDDLFPKARFLDALSMVEKMGHKKRLQMMRMEWINESKPHNSTAEDDIFDDPNLPQRDTEREKTALRIAPIFEPRASEWPKTPEVDMDIEEEDLYGATPRPTKQLTASTAAAPVGSIFGGQHKNATSAKEVEDGPPDDELDALLAEEEEILRTTSGNPKPTAPAVKPSTEDNFNDEMEAMAEMDMEW